jgi:hypothetical protein
MIEGNTVKKSRLVLGAFSSGETSEPAPLVTSGLSDTRFGDSPQLAGESQT